MDTTTMYSSAFLFHNKQQCDKEHDQPGRSYLNASGGAVIQNGQIVQSRCERKRLARAS